MADFCCKFQPLPSTHSIRSSSPSKHFHHAPAHVHPFNSRTPSLHLTLITIRPRPAPLASEFDVVSTHEHSDGSLLFRFGDPSEVAENVETEESEEEATEEEAGKEMNLVEGEIGESVNDIDLVDLVSNKKTEVTLSTPPVVRIEHNGNVGEGLNGEYGDSTAMGASIVDDSTKVELMENETATYVNSTSGVNIEHIGNAEEGISEAHKDSSSNMENKITATLEVLETETTDVMIPCDSLIPVSENNGFEKYSLETQNDTIIEDSREVSDDIIEASIDELTDLKSATKSQDILMTNFILSSGAALLPHPSKALTGREDAYFVAGQTWIGVADGVGEWSLKGTNVGAYAQELVKSCERLASDCSSGDSVNSPLELLNLSMAETKSPGSSTVLIAQIDGQALNVANIGDSGFIILRKGSVYKRSSPMYYAFYFPFRIERGDDPSSLAELYRVDLEEEDVIITATDGLLDNLYDQDISSIVSKSLAADKGLKEIAGLLANKAQEIGKSESTRSPFCDDAQAAGFAKYSGGKLDAVAVIVSVVKRQTNPETV